jgi:hypothetical protein
MDIGDFIFFFIFILVIIGRVLSWIFKQFVENKPIDNSENTVAKPHSIKDYFVDWIRALEDRIDNNQWTNRNSQSSDDEWEPHDTQTEYIELKPPLVKINHSDPKSQPAKLKKALPHKRHQKKIHCKPINMKKAMIHYEILSPPISLRQEYQYDRHF